MEMTFGNDNGPKMSSVTNAESAVVSVPPSQLLSGQGYLLGRLTHDASWPVLIRSLTLLLDSKHSKQWYAPPVTVCVASGMIERVMIYH